jgi:hypothetical protein
MVPKVSGVPIVQSLRSSLDRSVPIVPDVHRFAPSKTRTESRSTVQTFNGSMFNVARSRIPEDETFRPTSQVRYKAAGDHRFYWL